MAMHYFEGDKKKKGKGSPKGQNKGKGQGKKHKNKKLDINLDLSPEKLEKFKNRYVNEVSKGFHIRIMKILQKPKEQWTPEEIAFLNKKLIPILEEVKDKEAEMEEGENEQ